ncbi:MAG TPA: amidohydrolase family protein, partial [Dehalococcoidia bacterium]|nr:amidohydrolase family protein [Dehalococcoidia bacterium]
MPRAIDVHIHPPAEPGRPELIPESMARYFRMTEWVKMPEEMAERYQELDLFGNILATDASANMGQHPITNEYVASIVKRWPKTFSGFASVDPWKGKTALYEIERAVQELGLIGVKFHPNEQGFEANDVRFYPIWELIQRLGVPVMFHMGMAGTGAGTPGGRGIKLRYSRPILVDDVAADFPELSIIMAHPQWPWQEEGIAVCLHKANVSMDISGWSPTYFEESLVNAIQNRFPDKVMFGSDYPVILPVRWMADWEKRGFKPEI